MEDGHKSRSCDPSGKCTGMEPKCTPLDCGVLTKPAFGKMEYNSTLYLSESKYTCHEEYSFKGGTPTRTCNETGHWND
ncbi:hypothetical protein DPMN_042341 [Dreissena polymorpha]|uniref:Sushi domain-containing protein n=1 Tax=Dreissena polymorpha TaxID=45954 RepID=A0A9D4D1V6_DREPO|nr:hypothetical protein DPMN_042341 [Dreissena polymorpha]